MVPNGWEVKKLEDVVSKTRKITYGIVVPGPYEPNGNLMIRAKDYSFGWQPIESIYRVSDQMHQSYKRSKVRKGDVLLTIVGSIGNTAIVPEDLEGANITQQTARLSFDEHDANFFYSVMSSGIGKKEIYRYAKSGVQPSLNLADIAKFKVPVPPFQEQQKIAKILSTWDKAISTTERLIDNSTQQKKALMQQLLTGKKRLLDESGKRFDGEWKKFKLEDVFIKISNGLTYDSKATHGLPVSRIETISTGRVNYEKVGFAPKDERTRKFKMSAGDILYSHINSLEHIGRVAYFEDEMPLYHGMNLLLLRVSGMNCSKFMYYLLSSSVGKAFSKSHAKSAVNQASISTSDMKSFKVILPKYSEQQKIATVLTNADKEIELLEQQLADLQQEKKALMQVLLTGKKRVVV